MIFERFVYFAFGMFQRLAIEVGRVTDVGALLVLVFEAEKRRLTVSVWPEQGFRAVAGGLSFDLTHFLDLGNGAKGSKLVWNGA